MRIQHNIMALNSHRQLGNNNSAVSKSLEKLSSGYRINRAGDDAAGLAISEKMRAQIKGLTAASDNSQDAISLVQTAEGGLQEVHSMLNRMQELATKSSNGTYTDKVDRKALQDEVDALKTEINRIADATDFNGIKLLDGSLGVGTSGGVATTAAAVVGAAADKIKNAVDFTVSAPDGFTVNVNLTNGATEATWAGKVLTINLQGTAEGTRYTQADIDKLIADASGAPETGKNISVKISSDIVSGGISTASKSLVSINAQSAAQASATKGNITVTADKAGDVAATRTFQITSAVGATGITIDGATGAVKINLESGKKYTANDINTMLSDAGAGMSIKFDGELTATELSNVANGFGTATALTGGAGLSAGGGLELQIGDTSDSYNQMSISIASMKTIALGIDSIDISNQPGAKSAIDLIKNAINMVSTQRGQLGAIQNRLEHTINNLGVTTENITAAESRIRDVDMAKEMMEFTKNSVLMQSAQAMLAQANQQPQSILQLLQ